MGTFVGTATTQHGREADATTREAKYILAEQFGVPQADITADTKLYEDLQGDSLDLVELVMTLEDEFGIEIPDDVAENWVTCGQVIDYMVSRA